MKIKADALGITLEEMNHEHDRDLYVKWVVWAKLRPILAEKYNVDLNNTELKPGEASPNTILVDYYNNEVQEYLEK
jgi:hypothetical protein